MKTKFLTAAILSSTILANQSFASTYFFFNRTFLLQQTVEVRGTVMSEDKTLVGATVTLVELQLITITDAKGQFRFENVPNGNYTVSVQYTGMKPLVLKFNSGRPINVVLQPNTIDIDGVQVVGERSNVKAATSTFISRQAIEHLQATSIAEVLQLLPGQTISNPSFSGVNSPSIRQISDSRSGSVAALGTSVLINGAQLSNTADMQAVNTATGGVLSSFSNATGKGTDLRQLTADNVESIEVIRGIPSVEYGDLTSGVIDVKTKATAQPLQAKFRLNPTLKQGWIGQGFGVGNNDGALFVDFDYTYAANKQIQESESYKRFNTSFQYTNTFGSNKNLYTNTTFSFGGYYDDSKIDPDLVANQVINQSENYDLRLSTNGRWNVDKKYARNIHYVLSAQLGFQNGYQQQQTMGELSAVSTSLVDITQEVNYLPSSYLQKLHLKGKPLNIHTRISDNFYLNTGAINHAIVIGGSYSFDKNFGEGKYYTDGLPPKVNGGLGFRPRKFSDVPAMNQLALYAEDKLTTNLFGRPFNIVGGIRYDLIQPFREDKKDAISPRINASYELFENFSLRGGYGLSAKAPSMIYMYPDPVYVDVFSLNHYKQDPSEQLALMTTRVFSSENRDLEMAKSKKFEIGADYKTFSLTFYNERVDNGFDMYQFYNFTNIPMYAVESQNSGEKPVLSPLVKDSLFVVDYNVPRNNINILNKGLEFDFNFGKVSSIRTSFTLNGAYNYTRSFDNNPFVYARRLPNQPYDKLGVFEGRGSASSRFVSTLRAIHQLPDIRLLITLTAQTIWLDQHEYINYSSKPYATINIANGGADQMNYLTQQEIDNISPSSSLYLPVADAYYLKESWDPLWLFNAKVTKEFGKNYGFSFYVNNITNSRPYLQNSRYPNQYEKRNIPIFFGSELSIKF